MIMYVNAIRRTTRRQTKTVRDQDQDKIWQRINYEWKKRQRTLRRNLQRNYPKLNTI